MQPYLHLCIEEKTDVWQWRHSHNIFWRQTALLQHILTWDSTLTAYFDVRQHSYSIFWRKTATIWEHVWECVWEWERVREWEPVWETMDAYHESYIIEDLLASSSFYICCFITWLFAWDNLFNWPPTLLTAAINTLKQKNKFVTFKIHIFSFSNSVESKLLFF